MHAARAAAGRKGTLDPDYRSLREREAEEFQWGTNRASGPPPQRQIHAELALDSAGPKVVPPLRASDDKGRTWVCRRENRRWSESHIGDFATEAEAND